jgi:hypothetical protein
MECEVRALLFGMVSATACLAVTLSFVAGSSSASAATITFGTFAGEFGEELESEFLGPTYVEQGMTFTNDQMLNRWVNGSPTDSDPTDSTAMFANFPWTKTIIKRSDGGAFDLISLDLDDVYNQGSPNGILDYAYTLSGGATGGGSFVIDDVPGFSQLLLNLVGVEEFSFAPSTALIWVQFDNVVVSGVAETPLPAALPLFGVALGGLLVIAKRRKSIST